MRFGSVCSGIEAASCGWVPLGWSPVFYSEIKAFPRAVLAQRWPGTPCHGDFRTIGAGDYGPVDVLVGGTPCQSFSAAGRRAGLDDPRGLLAFDYVELAGRLGARWLVWENVPNILGLHHGRVFGAFIRALAECGYGFAWRVLDARYFGVPQRRRRVFLVGHLGDWRRAAAVLFEPESLSGPAAPGRGARQGPAAGPGAGAAPHGAAGADPGRVIAYGGNNTSGPIELATSRMAHAGPHGRLDFESETFVLSIRGRQDGAQVEIEPSDAAPALRGSGGGSSRTFLADEWSLRRLTPLECERLQGFEDGYTDIAFQGRPARDGLRYEALGESMAVPVMRWLGERIALVDGLELEAAA